MRIILSLHMFQLNYLKQRHNFLNRLRIANNVLTTGLPLIHGHINHQLGIPQHVHISYAISVGIYQQVEKCQELRLVVRLSAQRPPGGQDWGLVVHDEVAHGGRPWVVLGTPIEEPFVGEQWVDRVRGWGGFVVV